MYREEISVGILVFYQWSWLGLGLETLIVSLLALVALKVVKKKQDHIPQKQK